MTEDLYWHCLSCGDHEAVEQPEETGYAVGDWEKCPCGGAAHVVTLRMGARFEQGIALGLSRDDAWKRAQRKDER